MSALRVLHVDDEPDIREVVGLALSLDPELSVRSCASGGDGLETAADWSPDLILLDVMMPGMDGPTTLAKLRSEPKTATIPVVFMTARAQARELEHFISLGAEGVIAKPFDPMTLAASVRNYAGGLEASIAARRVNFLERVRGYAAELAQLRAVLGTADEHGALQRIRNRAHSVAGGAGVFGLAELGAAAAELETAAIDRLDGRNGEVAAALDALLERISKA